MRIYKTAMTAFCVLGMAAVSQPANAALVNIEASAVNNLADSLLDEAVNFGSLVSLSLQLDVGVGLANEGFTIVNILGGTYTWDNGGPQVFNITGRSSFSSSASGNIGFTFTGNGPTIAGVNVTNGTLGLNIGTNPNTSPEQLSDLLLSQTTITNLGFRLTSAGSPSSTLPKRFDGDITGRITGGQVSTVPLPASLVLLLSGLAGLGAAGYRRRK